MSYPKSAIRYSRQFGALNTSFTVSHNLNARWPIVEVWDSLTGLKLKDTEITSIQSVDENSIQVELVNSTIPVITVHK